MTETDLEFEIYKQLKNTTDLKLKSECLKKLEKYEPILIQDNKRLVMFPIKYQKCFDQWKKHETTFWTAEEISFTKDPDDFKKLNKNHQYFIKHILAFFASFDGIVNENLALNFYNEIQVAEARAYYSFQMMMESIHSLVYSQMIDILPIDNVEKYQLLNSIKEFISIKKLAEWVFKWTNKDRSFAERIIAFGFVEGILFSGPFCAIFSIKKMGLMPGLCQSNELISRDENIHTENATIISSLLKYQCPYDLVVEICREVVDLEKEFINESLPCSLIGMNATEMSKYIEYVADQTLLMFGYDKLYKSQNPFEWMDLISVMNKTNFFEKNNGNYNSSSTRPKETVVFQDF